MLQNQLGIRPPSRPPVTTSLPTTTAPVLGGPGVTEVSPEFLAALPPAIQEEVSCFYEIVNSTFIFIFYSLKRPISGVGAFVVTDDKCSIMISGGRNLITFRKYCTDDSMTIHS